MALYSVHTWEHAAAELSWAELGTRTALHCQHMKDAVWEEGVVRGERSVRG